MVEVNIKVVMERQFKDKIDWLSKNYDKEIAGFITGEIDGEEIVLEDLIIPEQEVGSAHVDIEGKSQVKLRKEFGNKCKKIIGEW